MSRAKALAVAAVLTVSCQAANAEFFTGNALLERCISTSMMDKADCIGYITGAADSSQRRDYCPPDGITRGQIKDIVVKFITTHASMRHHFADVLVAAALMEVWPCKARTAPQRGEGV